MLGCKAPEHESAQERSIRYPETRIVDAVDDFHGTTVPDPYRWLEALDEPEVREWAAAQTSLAREVFGDADVRGWFADRIARHGEAWWTYDERAPRRAGGSPVRLDSAEDGERQRVVVAEADGTMRVLADPGADEPDVSVTGVEVAPDGAHAAVQWSVGGSEWVTTRIVRVDDGVMLDETLDGLRWSAPVWTADGAGFFYVRYGRPLPGQRVALREATLGYHQLDTPQEADHVVWRTPPGDVELIIDADLSPGGRYLVISEGTGADTDGIGQLMARLLILDLEDARTPDVLRQPALVVEDRVAGYRMVGEGEDGTLHVITDRDAPRRRVVAIAPSDPSPSAWRELIPQHEDVLDRIHRLGDHYVGLSLRDAQSVLRVYTRDGRLRHTIELPPFAIVDEVGRGATDSEVFLGHSSYLLAPIRWYVDLATGAVREDPPPTTALRGGPYEVTRVRYESRDGVRVPMFIVHKRGLDLDGSHPVVLHGYGASHTPNVPFYDETALAWLEAGGVYAVPNVRGGGAFGRDWWEAANLERKQRTFDDFIAAAEYLVREGWTNPDRLAITGMSFGGLLVTAVMTERPDLFAAVVADVPRTDLIRVESGRHRAQTGSPDDPDQFPFVLRHSSQQRVRDGRCYPATLVTTAFNDERQPAWAAFKFTAALQAAQACDRPIVLRADQVGGHVGKTWAALQEHWVDWLTFVATALDVSVGP
jgi:prolyl oligopeptidase